MGDFENKAEEFGGKAKEAFGDATGNDELKNEGKADQVKSNVKDAVSDAGDKIKEGADKVLGAFKKDN
ncbi:CsbD family protein [Corynebacterium poyangense]|uniref:CsbD family protein n=1 Tax=Corynebacterium poyangense TaxID=2684405 RepID=A0A7H0SLG0_9CORY|nr:CsbD family protein [Corynebacterium poyangense]MBZ8177479.1 CsbD family protein [Corynebacterium poyangense]QNQ89385.1 CsbD family protein [Corynebacterium poyangense]